MAADIQPSVYSTGTDPDEAAHWAAVVLEALEAEEASEGRRMADAIAEDLQITLEGEMKDAGMQAYLARLARSQGTDESTLPYGQALLRSAVVKVADRITSEIERIYSGGAGRRPDAVPLIRDMDPRVLAYLGGKGLIDGISSAQPLVRVAQRIGTMVEDEQRLSRFAAENPGAFKWTMDRVEGASSRSYRAGVSRKLMQYKGIEWTPWRTARRLSVGTWLIEQWVQATGIIRIETVRTKNGRTVKDTHTIVPQEGTRDWIEGCSEATTMGATEYWPTVIPPKPWTGPWGGGYHTPIVPPLPLVKTKGHAGAAAYLEELEGRDMEAVYAAVNGVQNTAWAIHPEVLDVLRQVVEGEVEVPGLPPASDLPLPEKPADISTNPVALKWWKKSAGMVHTANSKARSRRVQLRRILNMAERFSKYPAFYFPHQMDFRGRLYAVPPFLNPQGADHAKGLLTFAQGKPIETEEQAQWLAIHVANTYGVDKVSFADRWNWAVEHHGAIQAAASDPLGAGFAVWTGADNPWQFLAACFEWAAFTAHGYGYVSSLPIALDGTCNGLQHYSAALLDPVGGAAVNLVPSDTPQDIYGIVAERVTARLEQFKSSAGKDGEFARAWLALGVDRKIAKRPVMTLPYGSTQYSVRAFVEEAVREKLADGTENPFAEVAEDGTRKDRVFEGACWLTPLLWECIGQTVVAARRAMTWLQDVAGAVAKEGLPIIWTTPDGFPVQQAYVDQKGAMLNTHLDGRLRLRIEYAEDTHVMDPRRQRNGIAPNWVHSMDAAALRRFVLLASEEGIDAFCLVHDSYGCRAADVPVATWALREAFVSLYRGRHALADFAEEVAQVLPPSSEALPAPPDLGGLDLEQVLDSPYFFA